MRSGGDSDGARLGESLRLIVDTSRSLNSRLTSVPEQIWGATGKGVSILDLKSLLLLDYITNVAYLLLHKLHSESIRDHPAVRQLIALRVTLDKLAPIESALRYQIEQLIKLATNADAEQLNPKSTAAQALRPNLSALQAGAVDESDSSFDTENQTRGGDEDALVQLSGSDDAEEVQEHVNNRGAFRVRKDGQTEFMGRDEERAERRRLKERARIRKSSGVRELLAQMSERPEEVRGGAGESDSDGGDLDRERYEEDNFVRLMVTKKDKKERAKREREKKKREWEGELGELEHFLDSRKSETAELIDDDLRNAGSSKRRRNQQKEQVTVIPGDNGDSGSEIEDDLDVTRKNRNPLKNQTRTRNSAQRGTGHTRFGSSERSHRRSKSSRRRM
uniref:Neuroguidin n=1 Tax=Timspurckia oligopyrenoides TaxID=708627 RepID=A0A7S0ZJL0_9RHOD